MKHTFYTETVKKDIKNHLNSKAEEYKDMLNKVWGLPKDSRITLLNNAYGDEVENYINNYDQCNIRVYRVRL